MAVRPGLFGLQYSPTNRRHANAAYRDGGGSAAAPQLIAGVEDAAAEERSGTAAETAATAVTASGVGQETASGTATLTSASDAAASGARWSGQAAATSLASDITATGSRVQLAAGTAVLSSTVLATGFGFKLTSGSAGDSTATDAAVAGTASETASGTAEIAAQTDVVADGFVVGAEPPAEVARRRRGLWRPLPDAPTVPTAEGACRVTGRSRTSAGGVARRRGATAVDTVASPAASGSAARSGVAVTVIRSAGSSAGRGRHTERIRREDELLLLGAL